MHFYSITHLFFFPPSLFYILALPPRRISKLNQPFPEVMMHGSSVTISPNSQDYIPPRPTEGPKSLGEAEWYWGDITR